MRKQWFRSELTEKNVDWHVKPYLTNGFSHLYQLGESTFLFRGVKSDLYFIFLFSMKFLQANIIVLRRHIWGYAVCLCPIKETPGVNELNRSSTSRILLGNHSQAFGNRYI